MRIAHVTMARVRGGVIRVLETLARHREPGDEFLVISGPGTRPSISIGGVLWEERAVRGNLAPLVLGGLYRTLGRFEPDALVIHACAPGELAILAALASRRWPTVVLEHLPEYQPLGTPTRNRLYAWLDRKASCWLAVSRAGARALEARWGLASGTIGHLHMGVEEPSPYLPDEEIMFLEEKSGRALILGLGSPEERKGFPLFCELAERMWKTSARFVWVGGPRRERRGYVEVWPWTSHVGGWLHRADMLLVPSLAEGLPLVVLEAMACGVPVIASPVGGIPEAITEGFEGLLLPTDDVDRWVGAVASLSADPVRRETMGKAARERWVREFTATAMVRRITALLREAMAAHRKRGRG